MLQDLAQPWCNRIVYHYCCKVSPIKKWLLLNIYNETQKYNHWPTSSVIKNTIHAFDNVYGHDTIFVTRKICMHPLCWIWFHYILCSKGMQHAHLLEISIKLFCNIGSSNYFETWSYYDFESIFFDLAFKFCHKWYVQFSWYELRKTIHITFARLWCLSVMNAKSSWSSKTSFDLKKTKYTIHHSHSAQSRMLTNRLHYAHPIMMQRIMHHHICTLKMSY